MNSRSMWLGARAEAVVEAVEDLEPRVVLKAKVECAAEAGEEAKAMPVGKVELEAKAGLAVEVGARVEVKKRVIYGARAEPGCPNHEVTVLKRAEVKTKSETGALDSAMLRTVIVCQGIAC